MDWPRDAFHVERVDRLSKRIHETGDPRLGLQDFEDRFQLQEIVFVMLIPRKLLEGKALFNPLVW
jgi:hypothetical protein